MIHNFNQFTEKTNEGFWDWLTGKKEETSAQKKEDGTLLDDKVEAFYATLEDFANSGKSVAVQNGGTYTYSKLVEDIQAALEFLGYELPEHGVDGYFGPETAIAIQKFNEDTTKISTSDNGK
jgi:peptidoglycan hydrolase-like protein with peptidoglycan-binding domain